MPLRCLDPTGRNIQSFDLTEEQWQALEHENRKGRHLRMPCCSSQVILKRSRRGTPFFAHKAVDTCTTAPESEAHLRLKRMAVEAARANGWAAYTEMAGISPSGEQWKADVLARKGNSQVAVEIQWSSQTMRELLRRQERYRRSGIRGLWLLRQPGFPITFELPAVCIGGSSEQGFSALIPCHSAMSARDRSQLDRWHQVLPMQAFLDAAFSRRLRFGVQLGTDAIISVRVGHLWCRSCGARTAIVTFIDVAFGPNNYSFTIPELGEHAQLLHSALEQLPNHLQIGDIKRRFSKTQQRSYVSNGCVHCDALIGAFFEHDAWDEQETLSSFPTQISKQWKRAIENLRPGEETWSVYQLADGT